VQSSSKLKQIKKFLTDRANGVVSIINQFGLNFKGILREMIAGTSKSLRRRQDIRTMDTSSNRGCSKVGKNDLE